MIRQLANMPNPIVMESTNRFILRNNSSQFFELFSEYSSMFISISEKVKFFEFISIQKFKCKFIHFNLLDLYRRIIFN